MLENMTPERIANSIMQDTTFPGYYVIVEGKKDYKFYRKFINENHRIKEAWGCEKAKQVLKILTERNFERKIGILDSDFSKILNDTYSQVNLFYTDFHDIEVMMLKSNAFKNVINIYCTEEKVFGFKKENNNDLLGIIFNLGTEIGLLRLANTIYDLGLIFKPEKPEGNKLKYRDFINEADLSFLGHDKMIETVINYSRNRSSKMKSKEEILNKLIEVAQKYYDIEQLVNGHDLTNILFILMKKVLKSTNGMLCDSDSVEYSLIMSYESKYFLSTQLFMELQIWSSINGVNLFQEELIDLVTPVDSGLKQAN
ncbi:DUF4435 domain-containing protein [Gorillibacterium massiliense]|uniref:DUF4435 domain-containing protein n=1 Tax=Gorillibacterium massiliense TaxID=1280390 RepID=UPI0004BCB37B|nr:DUF4435 domain-containing protein [Gorillibacterium massiliense]